MNCVCHNEPAYWQTDRRMLAGGWWQCAVGKREASRATDTKRRAVKTERQRERYDRDPIYRIEKRLHDDARRRRERLERRRARFATDREG